MIIDTVRIARALSGASKQTIRARGGGRGYGEGGSEGPRGYPRAPPDPRAILDERVLKIILSYLA